MVSLGFAWCRLMWRTTWSRSRRAATAARSMLTGAAATLVDLSVLALLVSAFGVDPRHANLPSLAAGVAVQFLGSRHFAFRVPAGRRAAHPLALQLGMFAGIEVVAFAVNALGFDLLAQHLGFGAAGAVAARAAVSMLVYWAWCYPLWRLVFASTPLTAEGSPAPRSGR